MKKFILISTLIALSNCDFERDLADCTNAGRCTNGAGSGIGFPVGGAGSTGGGTGFSGGGTGFSGGGTGFSGGGTGFSGGGTGITGGGTGITGGGTGITGGGTGITGGGTGITGGGTGVTGGGSGLRTDCPAIELSRDAPTYYGYFDGGAIEWSNAQQTGPASQDIEFIVHWTSGGAPTNVTIPVVGLQLDGGAPDNMVFRVMLDGGTYHARLGTISVEAGRGPNEAITATISNGYFYNNINESACFFIPLLKIRTPNPHCTAMPSDVFPNATAQYHNSSGIEYVSLYSLEQQTFTYGLTVQARWASNGVETGATTSRDAGYRFESDATNGQYISYINKASGSFLAKYGTLNVVNITRGDAGVFRAELKNVEFYGTDFSLYSECYSLAHQYFDSVFP